MKSALGCHQREESQDVKSNGNHLINFLSIYLGHCSDQFGSPGFSKLKGEIGSRTD